MRLPPVILLTPSNGARGEEFRDRSLSLSGLYGEVLALAGGVPLVLPTIANPVLVAEAVARCDGVMLTGGDDLQASLYRKRLTRRLRATLGAPDAERDYAELLVLQEVFRQRKPLLAICRGHQLLNVALGGDLLVDIKIELPGCLNHRRMDRKDEKVHDLWITAGSRMAEIFRSERVTVNSSHHQGVLVPAPGLVATGVSADGLVEAMELADPSVLPYLLSVQFHPERLAARHPEFLRVFASLVRACQNGREVVR